MVKILALTHTPVSYTHLGTKSELKDQKILEKGDVLKSADFNKDYFTQIDKMCIRDSPTGY